jgi:MoaA/NifB/PqqE/SkfB family radical SAM enzyme
MFDRRNLLHQVSPHLVLTVIGNILRAKLGLGSRLKPLMREDIISILKKAKELRFKTVTMATNMSLMHKKMEALDYLTGIAVSLDMTDMKKYSRIIAVSESVLERMMKNIRDCAALQREKNFTMTIGFVANSETLPEIYAVIDFCMKHEINFTLGPELLVDETVEPELAESKEYQEAISYLLKKRKESNLILLSSDYLETIRSLRHFECYPSLFPRINPNGDLCYPCKPLDAVNINVLKMGSYEKALREGYKIFGPRPKCSGKCFQNCIIMPSQLISRPIRTIMG